MRNEQKALATINPSELSDLRLAIISVVRQHYGENAPSDIDENLVSINIDSVDKLWWLLSHQLIRLVVNKNKPSLVSVTSSGNGVQFLEFSKSAAVDREILQYIDKPLLIARHGKLCIYVSYDELNTSMRLQVKEEPHISKMPIGAKVELKFPEARPILEASLRGIIIDAALHPQSGVVTIFYAGGLIWEVYPAHPDYETFKQLGQGREVMIGRELSAHVFFTNGAFYDGEYGRRIDESTVTLNPDGKELLRCIRGAKNVIVNLNEDGFTGEISLTLEGVEQLIKSKEQPKLFNALVDAFEDGKPVEVGLTTNGQCVFFHAVSGIIGRNIDRQADAMPSALRLTPLFSEISEGSYYFVDAKGNIATMIGGREKSIKKDKLIYPILYKIITGNSGYCFEALGTNPDGSTHGVVHIVSQSNKGITINSYQATDSIDGLDIQNLSTREKASLFPLPSDVLKKPVQHDDEPVKAQIQKHVSEKPSNRKGKKEKRNSEWKADKKMKKKKTTGKKSEKARKPR